jgi:predicted alpha-1,2-mannosidase
VAPSLLRLALVPYALVALFACGGDGDPDAAIDAAVDAATDVPGPPPRPMPEPPDEPYDPPPPFVVDSPRDLVRYVDPFVGSLGSGNVIPGALVPHGMVRASPDSAVEGGSIDAYEYGSDRIEGFTHLHLEGPGGSLNGYNSIRVMPVGGALDLADFSSAYSHDEEEAEPGYYAVTLADTGVRVELTATSHAAMHRYTFPEGEAGLVLDLMSSNGTTKGMSVEFVGDRVIRGRASFNVHPGLNAILVGSAPGTADVSVYYYIELSEPFASSGVWRATDPPTLEEGARREEGYGLGAYGSFARPSDGVIEARIGISLVDAIHAEANMRGELEDRGFDEVRARASEAWNQRLNRIQIEAGDETLTAFYTALYHSLFQPADYTEAEGWFVVSTSGSPVVKDGGGRPFYTDDWCMWDTFRTLHPLGTIVEPEIRGDVVRSMLVMYEEGGWLPKCTWNAQGYSRVMTANNAIPIIVDAWAKGLRDFDEMLAFEAMAKNSREEIEGFEDGGCGYFGLGTPAEYETLGYFGYECDPHQAASMTLEYAYTDHLMALYAAGMGLGADEAEFAARSRNFENQWDDETGFMRPRMRDGSWMDPFDPAATNDANGFVEASAWIFSFFVPHDVPALIALHGGEAPFLDRLDAFYDDGHFDAANQPSFHIAWLYDRAGAPARTQARVAEIAGEEFDITPNGLPGNDDAGSMSALLVLATLGIYPIAPGVPEYDLSTPLLDRAVIHLNPAHYDGGTFSIEVTRSDPADVYIQSAELNGAPLETPRLTHEQIVAGGTLRYVVGPTPSTWGEAIP